MKNKLFFSVLLLTSFFSNSDIESNPLNRLLPHVAKRAMSHSHGNKTAKLQLFILNFDQVLDNMHTDIKYINSRFDITEQQREDEIKRRMNTYNKEMSILLRSLKFYLEN